ncbi:MAG: aldo/keto reductase [Candidatus Binatus sp.]|uniref:aldo/keto reductase n=1 Tax=Candidatus Binatus sp. TaxID=2811406 RepID=UPI0027180427|nr:aldo/keto reductase [Candidatus Binatus sp.]MDO8433159.1 aldo/keto reductase [Candidatus Binatus sp.]
MEYRRIGATGLKVSELCLGCMTFGRETDEAVAGKILDRYLDAGGNFLDTANVYAAGASEEILGNILGKRRNSLVLATKVRFNANVFMGKPVPPNQIGLSRGHIMSEVENSLRRMKTDYIDLYQVHSWDFETPIDETMRALDDLVRQGKVRYLGASNFTAWQLMKSLWVSDKHNYARFDCLQPQYSLISRDIEREIMPACIAEGVGVIPWSPLGGGFLTGKYRSGQRPPEDGRLTKQDLWGRLANERNYQTLEAVEQIAKERGRPISQVALAWVNQQRGVSSVIYGARTEEQNEQNLGAIGFKLEAAEIEALSAASAPAPEYPTAMQSRLPGYPRP